ncbi:protein DD3-3-like [Clytia hemisphaerica]|uniref:Uncharacterized protein n=1 Tax=Clytia hemisphaerica TaxID=252671 RepID=A0A7M5WXF8_9CNID
MNNRNTAINTRQNPQGTRRGYECPEERDYYPYWSPSPWKDIAIMTNNISRCDYLKTESENVKSRFYCKPPPGYLRARQANAVRNNLPLDEEDCEKIVFAGSKAEWVEAPPLGGGAPECLETPKSRDNHNGNGPGGFPNTFNWTIPNDINDNCALRLRYNISTGEFPAETDSSMNANNNNNPTQLDIASLVGLSEAEAKQRGYVFEGNPTVQPLKATVGNVNIGAKLQLQLAINTAQYGRTFEDRSHSFQIRQKPENIPANAKIHNLNVRGKRGNIVQVYPAVEYDFVPNRLEMNVDDYIHIQWTGSNTNPENNDGQGLRGTDRSNIAVTREQNYPEGTPGMAVPIGEKFGHWGNNYPEHLNAANFLGLPRQDRLNLALVSPGQFKGELSELDDAGTYFDLGPRKITSNGTGTFHYMCTRNNNFSNRSQKGRIVVNSTPKVEKDVGFMGGEVTLNDMERITIPKGMLTERTKIEIAQCHKQDYEIGAGDSTESKYMCVKPFREFADGKKATIQMKVKSSGTEIYRSTDTEHWEKIEDVEYDDGVVKFQSEKGGVFVARSNYRTRNIIIGCVVALVVIAVLVGGVFAYCRRNPESWMSAKRNIDQIKLSTKNQI